MINTREPIFPKPRTPTAIAKEKPDQRPHTQNGNFQSVDWETGIDLEVGMDLQSCLLQDKAPLWSQE